MYNSANCEQCENGIEREKSAKKHLENNHLQTQEGEIASTSNRNKFKCDECDFLGDSTNGMKMHMTEAHEMECDICNQSFRSEDKLEYHICKLHIENPSFETLYIKDWNDRKGCSPIFCNEEKNEVAILHTEKCWEMDGGCGELPSHFVGVSDYDKNAVYHTYFTHFVKKNIIDWKEVEIQLRYRYKK